MSFIKYDGHILLFLNCVVLSTNHTAESAYETFNKYRLICAFTSFWSRFVFIISPHTQEIRQQPHPEQGGPPPRPIKHAIIEQNNTDHHVLSSMFVFFLLHLPQ